MVIRNPRGDETKKVYDLWQKCFHDPKPFADYFFENLYKPSNTICVFDGERLLSSLQIFYHTALFSGMLLKAAYIAGVSTHPRERNKGYASLLMNEAEKRLSGENIDIVTLIPFRFSFYEKYGYRCISYLYHYSVKSGRQLSFEGVPSGSLNPIEIYSNFTKSFEFTFERDSDSFSEISQDVCVGGGREYLVPGGYMYIYRSRKGVYIPEIAYENEETLFSMLSHLSQFGGEVTLRSGMNLLPYFSETDVKIEVKPHVMIKELTPLNIETGFKNYINMLGWV